MVIATRVLGTAVLADLPGLVLRLGIPGMGRLEHIARPAGLVLGRDTAMEKHMTILRQCRRVPGIGTALKEMHGQALGTWRARQPAGVEQLLCKPVLEPDEQ